MYAMLHLSLFSAAPDMVMSAGTSVISETELSFKWDQPHLINGALRSYRVTLSVLEDYGVLYNSTSYVLDPATTTYNASGLGELGFLMMSSRSPCNMFLTQVLVFLTWFA